MARLLCGIPPRRSPSRRCPREVAVTEFLDDLTLVLCVLQILGAHHQDRSESVNPPWISSIAARRSTDLLVSGSNDGMLRMWQADVDSKVRPTQLK